MLSTGSDLRLPFVQRVWKHTVARKDNRALYQVLQLAYVPGPGMPLECRHGFRRNATDVLPHAPTKHLYEMGHKSRNVFPALSESRHQDGEHVQTIIQITAELTPSYHIDEVPIACGYQPDIHFVSSTAS